MQENELRVMHIASGNELIVSKSYYHNSPDDYEVLEGEVGKVAAKEVFAVSEQPKVKMAKQVTKNKMAKPLVANKSVVPAPVVS